MSTNEVFWLLMFCHLFCLSIPTDVRIVGQTSNSENTVNDSIDYNDLKGAKSEPSNYSGPSQLKHLIGKCFLYSSDKYLYRVCPFDNITQHERLRHTGAYNGIIGIWKEWTVVNNTFDSLMFYGGDDCDKEVKRSAKLVWICDQSIGQNYRVVDITEPKKCFYEISFASQFGCQNRNIYSHLTEELKRKWDQIETNYFYKELTQFGYESALHDLWVESGIVVNGTNDGFGKEVLFETKEQCFDGFVSLREENVFLLNRIKSLENDLKNKK